MVPLLGLLSRGPRTLHRAIWELASLLPLTAAERHELDVDFVGSPLNRRVSGAWGLLERAALIEGTGQILQCRLSERGRSLLEENPTTLTVAFLERYPEFLQARERTRREVSARRFRDLRLEFYAGGRRLMRGSIFSATSDSVDCSPVVGLRPLQRQWGAAAAKCQALVKCHEGNELDRLRCELLPPKLTALLALRGRCGAGPSYPLHCEGGHDAYGAGCLWEDHSTSPAHGR